LREKDVTRGTGDREQWRRFSWVMGGAVASAVALVLFALLVLDPYGLSPVGLEKPRPLVDVNQRWMYPQVIRYSDHDSLVLGTSTSRLLRPADLEAAFGGRFANLSLNDGRAWEQLQVSDLFLRERGPPRTLWIGLDTVWCDARADVDRITDRGWPAWLWGEPSVRDLARVIEPRTIEIAARQIGHWLGIEQARYDSDGYGDFTPGEAAYDIDRAQTHIWGNEPRAIEPQSPPHVATAEQRAAWQFPALLWLDEILARKGPGTLALLVFMPVHVAAQPRPGSAEAAREALCKAEVERIARERNAVYVDMRLATSLTTTDANYWDRLHWRAPVAATIIQTVKEAAETAR